MGRPFNPTLKEFKLTPSPAAPKKRSAKDKPQFTASDPEAWEGRETDAGREAELKAKREAAEDLKYKVDVITQTLSYRAAISTTQLLGILQTKKPLAKLARTELEVVLRHMVDPLKKAKMTKDGSVSMWTRL